MEKFDHSRCRSQKTTSRDSEDFEHGVGETKEMNDERSMEDVKRGDSTP